MSIKKYIKLSYIFSILLGVALAVLMGAVQAINILNSNTQKEYSHILKLNQEKMNQLEKGKKFLDDANNKLKSITPYRVETRTLQKNIEQIFADNDALAKKIVGFSPFIAQVQMLKNGGIAEEGNCVNYANLQLKVLPQDILAQSPKEGSLVAADAVKMVLELGLQNMKIKSVQTTGNENDAIMNIVLIGKKD